MPLYALRVFRPEQVDTCQREMAAMEAAHQAKLPVPAIHIRQAIQSVAQKSILVRGMVESGGT